MSHKLGQYEGNILDTFNFSTEEVHAGEAATFEHIYSKSTGRVMLHPRIIRALEDKLVRPFTDIFNNSVETGIIHENWKSGKRNCYSQERKQARTWKLQSN